MSVIAKEHEAAARELSRANALIMGTNYLIDVRTKFVTVVMVWQHGGIASMEHFDAAHGQWRREYERAIRQRSGTFWCECASGATPRET